MAYDTWVARVIRTVPEDRLLVFAPTDGWKPLCDFLSPLRESIHKKCQTILENKQPYPFENETKKLEAVFFCLWHYFLGLRVLTRLDCFAIGGCILQLPTQSYRKAKGTVRKIICWLLHTEKQK